MLHSLNPDANSECDLKKYCHINTNETDDRFVGIRIDTDSATVCFPIGYDLPTDDAQIRKDIRLLIHILAEFVAKDGHIHSSNSESPLHSVDFPINAYMTVIEYYLSANGKYYTETDLTYKSTTNGSINWPRTIKNQTPFIQNKDGFNSFAFTSFTVRLPKLNDTNIITQINKFCVYNAFTYLGWLYASHMPEKPKSHPDVKTSITVIKNKLSALNDDKKKSLFKAMYDMLCYLNKQTSKKQICFGTENFEIIWEKLIDRAFGVKNKDCFLPKSRWLLDYGYYKEKHPLMPDTVMVLDGKYYVLDAKYYKYGLTGSPDHLPNGTSINKQITYGEYLEKYKGISEDSIFNAFIMPFNMAANIFEINEPIGNIGEAIGCWRHNKKYYERIQGIVLDIRHLMYCYSNKSVKEKIALAECIEKVTIRSKI